MVPKNAKRLSVDVMLQRVETGRANGTGFLPASSVRSMRRAYNMAVPVRSKKMPLRRTGDRWTETGENDRHRR
jgi:hypothetical protein